MWAGGQCKSVGTRLGTGSRAQSGTASPRRPMPKIVGTSIGRASTLAIVHEHDGQPSGLNHIAECLRRRTAIVFQKRDDAAGFEEPADGCEETPVQLPILIVKAQFTRQNVDKMRGITDHQIPLLGCWDAVEIVGVIDRNPLRQPILCNSTLACLNRFRVYVGETHRSCEESRRLEEIPGIGLIVATALVAEIGD